MSDPTSIASSLITQTIIANARNSGSAKVEIISLPQNLQALENAQNLRGQIVQIDNNGNVTINTDQGQVVIRTDQAVRLENGAPIEIRIDAGNPPTSAALRPATIQENPQTQTLPQIDLLQTLSLSKITGGVELNLTPINNAQGLTQPFLEQIQSRVSPLAPLNISLNELGDITLNRPRLEGFTLPTNSPLISPTGEEALSLKTLGEQINIPFREIAAQLLSAPLQDPITNTDKPRISALSTIQIDKIVSPEPSISKVSPKDFALLNTKIGETSATLQGFTENQNFAVLRISAPDSLAGQNYALQVPIEDIPVGSKISINIIKTDQSPTTQSLPILTTSYFLTPQSWSIFQEVGQALAQATPQTAQVFNTVLPNAASPSNLGASMLFFVAAMRSGDIQGWLGDKAADALKRAGKSDILGRLGRELSGMARMNADNISGDWRALSLPLAWQNEIHRVAVHYRREDDRSNSEDQQGSGYKTRFIMDLSLSNMGKVQLDGLFTGSAENNIGRLDLVLRTEQSFSQAMKQEMRLAYLSALSETKITGELSFQDHLDSWVRITPDEVKEYEAEV